MLKRNGPHPEIPGKSRQEFPTQDITDLQVIEEIDCLPEDYQPIAVETPHPQNAQTGLSLILVAQGPSLQSDPPKMERVYMTLPGAWTTDTRIDPDGATVTIRKRKQLNRLILTSESVVAGIWTKTFNGPGGDAVVGDEIEEVRPVLNNGAHVRSFPSYSVEIPERAIPQKLRAALPTNTAESIAAGTASMPTLATGDLFRSQVQIDSTSYRLKVTNLPLSSLPISVVDHSITEQFGGGPTTITWTLSSTVPTIDEGFLVLTSKADVLGNGLYLKTTELRDGSAWPILDETAVDETLHVPIPTTSQVIAGGTASTVVVGDVETEVRDLDYVRSKKIIRTFPTSDITSYSRVLHNNCNLDLPLQLVSLTAYYGTHGGAGTAGDAATNYSLGGNGSGSLNVRASCQGSAAVVPELGHVLKAFRGHGLPCFHVLCLVVNTASRSAIRSAIQAILTAYGISGTVNEWPAFSPQPITIRCIGTQSAVRLEASAGASSNTRYKFDGTIVSSGEGRRQGSSASVEVGVNQKIIYIPPSIHGAVSIAGGTTQADIGPTYNSSSVINASAWGGPITTSLATPHATGDVGIVGSGGDATPGVTSVPSSGLYLTPRGIMSEPDRKFNRIRVLAEVVDFANVI